MMYKTINQQAPSYFTHSITLVSDREVECETRGADTFLMELPLCHMVKGQNAFSLAEPKLWNPCQLKLEPLPQAVRMYFVMRLSDGSSQLRLTLFNHLCIRVERTLLCSTL